MENAARKTKCHSSSIDTKVSPIPSSNCFAVGVLVSSRHPNRLHRTWPTEGAQEGNMNVLKKYKFWIGGAFCLFVIALIIGAIRPKRVSGAASAAPLEVQVFQVEQKDVPIYGEWIGTLDGLVN